MLDMKVFLKSALVLILSGSGTSYGADVMVLNADDWVFRFGGSGLSA